MVRANVYASCFPAKGDKLIFSQKEIAGEARPLRLVAKEDGLSNTGAEQGAWPWPDSLDALVAAPDHHRLLLENEEVRVLEVRIAPGQFVPVHTHRWPSVVFTLSGDDFIRRDAGGNVLLDTRITPFPKPRAAADWLGPLGPHSVENVGRSEIRLLSVELKRGQRR
jgi:hypothetical protein